MGFLSKLFYRPPKPGKPRPVTDASFEQNVLASDLPVVVDFSSPKCSPCQVMKGLLDEIGPDYVGRVNIFQMNVDENPETAMKFQIMSVPTLIFFKRGRPRDKITGLMPLNPLREKFDKLARL